MHGGGQPSYSRASKWQGGWLVRKAERPWIVGAAAAIVALVIMIGFAVSYSPAEPTEPQTTVPVFNGTTGVPGSSTAQAAPVLPGASTAAPASSTAAPAATTAAQGATTEAQGGSSGGGDDSAGKTVFASNCAGCHGADGTGGVGPDLTTLAAAADEATVVKQVTNGGQIMPSFSGTLSSQQIQDVAAYVSKDLAGH
jgi:mono/diheme cytochrome c family protein